MSDADVTAIGVYIFLIALLILFASMPARWRPPARLTPVDQWEKTEEVDADD